MEALYSDSYQRQNYNVAIYCRLSNEDGEKVESNSIGNQRDILTKFIKEKGWNIKDTYIDDGYSGLNFDRPEFQRMVKDIEDGKISLVITKDMSRLGRDYIEVGYYIEKYFPENRVRFIALNDNIDTERDMGNNDITPFKAIVNDMYSKDISKKVRSVFNSKRKAGKFIGAFAPYGYIKDPEDNNKLIIDEEASIVVKRIFDLYLSGNGYTAISHILNNEGILCPAAYKRKNLGVNVRGKMKFPKWCFSSVRSILMNPVYKGSVAQNKYRKVNYKSQKLIAIDKKDWIIVEDTHEPIASEEEFNLAQALMETKSNYDDNLTIRKQNKLFSGFTVCGDCGERMTYHKTPSGYHYLICSTYKRYGKNQCTRHSIKEDKLENMILQQTKEIFHEYASREILEEEAKKFSSNKENMEKKYKAELNLIKNRLEEIDKMTLTLYEDKIKGIINEEKYLILDKGFDNEKLNLIKRNDEIQNKLITMKEKESEEEKIKKRINMILNIDELNRLILSQLVEKIDIFEDEKINITYKFKDLL